MMAQHCNGKAPVPAAARAARSLRPFTRPFNLLLAACAWIAAGLMRTALAQAPGLDAAGLLAQVYPDAACSEERVVGLCHCGSMPCGLRIQRYVPVAFVETTRAPGDSLFDFLPLPTTVAGASASSALSTTDNTAEAHVWSLPGVPIPGLACLTCGAMSAAVPAMAMDGTAAACGPAAAIAQALSAAAAATGSWLPRLAYASELDILNWRTGCRDLANPAMNAPDRLLACAAIAGRVAQEADDSTCLGLWGPMAPRQMRDIGPPPVLYSAKTAVRAMSIARDQIGSFSYPVDTGGKLQQAYPAISACFRVGQLPLPRQPGSPRPALVSPDGRYGWIYWRPTSCCIGFAAARQCLRPR
jgi:hypothetical protein